MYENNYIIEIWYEKRDELVEIQLLFHENNKKWQSLKLFHIKKRKELLL
jgi:hypothetical protein